MEALRPQYPVGALTDALKVSKSGFHAHRHRHRRPRRQRDAVLRPLVAGSFARSRKTYGPLRVRADLQEIGERCGKNRIGRLLREQALRPAQKRRFRPKTTDSRHPHQIAENWLAKVPAPERPGMVCQRPPALPFGQRLRPLAISLRSVGRAILPISKLAKAGSISPSPWMAARAVAWPTTAART